MPWNITNQQQDDMTLNLDNGGNANLPGNGNVNVNDGIATIAYHRLTYTRVGGWVFAPNIALSASYGGGQNIDLRSPDGSTMIFHYEGP